MITSSLVYDILVTWLVCLSVFGKDFRPVVGIVVIVILRQLNQAITFLPLPEGIIWHYPGFPSLNVTYGISTDFFFSGHTAISVFCALQILKFYERRSFYALLAISSVLFEIATVLILRVHYFMDVYAALMTALFVHFYVIDKLRLPRALNNH